MKRLQKRVHRVIATFWCLNCLVWKNILYKRWFVQLHNIYVVVMFLSCAWLICVLSDLKITLSQVKIAYHIRNAWVFLSIFHSMGKCSEIHPMGKFWEIVFFHQILVMWEMYGFSHEFLIKWENATKLALRKEPGILIFPRFSRSMGKFSKTHLITNLSSGKLRANQEHLDHNIRKQFRRVARRCSVEHVFLKIYTCARVSF